MIYTRSGCCRGRRAQQSVVAYPGQLNVTWITTDSDLNTSLLRDQVQKLATSRLHIIMQNTIGDAKLQYSFQKQQFDLKKSHTKVLGR